METITTGKRLKALREDRGLSQSQLAKKADINSRVLQFQVVPPCGGHPMRPRRSYWLSICFKSCPRVGGIGCSSTYLATPCLFQVVPPCGGHPPTRTSRGRSPGFKSCPRVGGISRW